MQVIRVDNTIYITQEYLTKHGVSAEYVRVAKSRTGKQTNSWQFEIFNNKCYFSYNSLPRSTAAKLETLEILYENAVETQNYISEIITQAKFYSFKAFLKSMSPEEAVSMAIISEASRYVLQKNISFRKSAFFKDLAADTDWRKVNAFLEQPRIAGNSCLSISISKPRHSMLYGSVA